MPRKAQHQRYGIGDAVCREPDIVVSPPPRFLDQANCCLHTAWVSRESFQHPCPLVSLVVSSLLRVLSKPAVDSISPEAATRRLLIRGRQLDTVRSRPAWQNGQSIQNYPMPLHVKGPASAIRFKFPALHHGYCRIHSIGCRLLGPRVRSSL